MKWLEVIELRTAGGNADRLESKLLSLVAAIECAVHTQKIKLYRQAIIETDFCIHIVHESAKVEDCGSELCLHLVSALKEYGLVNHGIWIER